MARRALDERNIRKLYKNPRGTAYVSLPKEMIQNLRWRSGQKVVVRESGKRLIIEDWKG